MIKKPEIIAYTKKIGALLILGLLFLIFANVRAVGPYDVSWGIDSFYSDTYNMQDLTFVWGGNTGNATNFEVTGCSAGNCFFNTSYDDPGNYTVSVYAKNSSGTTVSNTASCSANVQTECPCTSGYTCVNNRCVYNMEVSCAAYASETATLPTLFFNPGSEVWWKAAVTGGVEPITYEWTMNTGSGNVYGSNNPEGALYVATVEGNPGDYEINSTYTTNLTINDSNGGTSTASCTIATKQCAFNSDCQVLGYPDYYICSSSTYTCVPPPPVFVDALSIDPGIVREGESCGLSWAADYADTCELYNNNTLVQIDLATSTDEFLVGPGVYHVQCINETTLETVVGGPAQCIYNPEIRES